MIPKMQIHLDGDREFTVFHGGRYLYNIISTLLKVAQMYTLILKHVFVFSFNAKFVCDHIELTDTPITVH